MQRYFVALFGEIRCSIYIINVITENVQPLNDLITTPVVTTLFN